MNIVKSTRRFEKWLHRHTSVVEPDLQLKHREMAESPFKFLRATFYRWAQKWPELCPNLSKAPAVLAVGDLHVENFGTWRDAEGRLIWGVNDFDEAWPMAYANDLVRLATSVLLAIEESKLRLAGKRACQSILEGYQSALTVGGRPFVLGENNTWLREIAESELRDPVHFWKKLDSLPRVRGKIPRGAKDALQHLLPEKDLPCKIVQRIAGLGSLGHPRFVSIADWCGGRIAREAKALVPSSCSWMQSSEATPGIQYQTIVDRAVRCPDPFVRLRNRWVIRRLSPHCSRIELATLPVKRDEMRLLNAMGWETANIHLGSRSATREVRRHLKRQSDGWLFFAATEMLREVKQDWRAWKKSGEEG